MAKKLDEIRNRAKTLSYDRRQCILGQLENFHTFYELLERKTLYAEVKPIPKQSTNFAGKRAYTDKRKIKYMKKLLDGLLATYGMREPPMEGPIVMTVVFSFPWVTEHKKEHKVLGWLFNRKRPDIENLCKPLLDCMTGHCYRDDSEIVGLHAYKIRSDHTFVAVMLDRVKEVASNPFKIRRNR